MSHTVHLAQTVSLTLPLPLTLMSHTVHLAQAVAPAVRRVRALFLGEVNIGVQRPRDTG